MMCLLALRFFEPLRIRRGHNGFYKLGDEKLLKWNAVKQLELLAPALPLYSALLFRTVVRLVHIALSPVRCLRAMGVDKKKNAVRLPAIFSETELGLEDHRSHVYTAEALPLTSAASCFKKSIKPLSSMMSTVRQV